MFQFPAVKVRLAGLTVVSPVSPEVTEMTTLLAGCASRTTVKVSVVADSETLVDPPVCVIVNPAVSLSAVAADTVWLATESKLSSEIASTTVIVRVLVMVPSMMLSSTPVTVTV